MRQFSTVERLIRATKFFLIFVGLCFVSVFIPALHFVLVPLFAFLAPFSWFFVFTQKTEVASAQGQCPYCEQVTALPRAKIPPPFRDSCEHCRQLLMVTSALDTPSLSSS